MAGEEARCQFCCYDLSHAPGPLCPECGHVILRRPRLPRAPQVSGASLLVVFGFGLLYPALIGAAVVIGIGSPFSNGLLLPILSPWSLMLISKPPIAILVGVLTGPFYGVVFSLSRISRRRPVAIVTGVVIVVVHLGAIVAVLASP